MPSLKCVSIFTIFSLVRSQYDDDYSSYDEPASVIDLSPAANSRLEKLLEKLQFTTLKFGGRNLAKRLDEETIHDNIAEIDKPGKIKSQTAANPVPQTEQYKSYLLTGLISSVIAPIGPMGRSTSGANKQKILEGILLSDEILDDLSKIDDYGCHCIFGTNWRHGRGKPLNSVDYACKDLTNCYKCIFMDETYFYNPEKEKEERCDPTRQDFNFPSYEDAKNFGILEACQAVNNNDSCLSKLCSCDTKFTINLIDQFFNGLQFDLSVKHDGINSLFFEDNCPIAPITGRPEKSCCGEYPTRFPYRVDKGRACCNGKTYEVNVHYCCDNRLSLNQCSV